MELPLKGFLQGERKVSIRIRRGWVIEQSKMKKSNLTSERKTIFILRIFNFWRTQAEPSQTS